MFVFVVVSAPVHLYQKSAIGVIYAFRVKSKISVMSISKSREALPHTFCAFGAYKASVFCVGIRCAYRKIDHCDQSKTATMYQMPFLLAGLLTV